ncbi:hypothetical protein U1Q18_014113 [Sarracenia purpurea var. burkii]
MVVDRVTIREVLAGTIEKVIEGDIPISVTEVSQEAMTNIKGVTRESALQHIGMEIVKLQRFLKNMELEGPLLAKNPSTFLGDELSCSETIVSTSRVSRKVVLDNIIKELWQDVKKSEDEQSNFIPTKDNTALPRRKELARSCLAKDKKNEVSTFRWEATRGTVMAPTLAIQKDQAILTSSIPMLECALLIGTQK